MGVEVRLVRMGRETEIRIMRIREILVARELTSLRREIQVQELVTYAGTVIMYPQLAQIGSNLSPSGGNQTSTRIILTCKLKILTTDPTYRLDQVVMVGRVLMVALRPTKVEAMSNGASPNTKINVMVNLTTKMTTIASYKLKKLTKATKLTISRDKWKMVYLPILVQPSVY